ncbi:MAG: acyl-CoA dehydrogenase family protein, partial [Actinomycetota bacterium]
MVSPPVLELLSGIDDLGPTLAKRSAEAERAGSLSPDTAADLRALGVHRALQPQAFGGLQDSIEAHMRIVSGVGRHCMAASWCVAVWSAHNWMIGSFPQEGQEQVWAEPDTLVSASIVPKNRFEAAGDEILVQGRFPFASGCDHAPWLGVGGLLPGPTPTYVICLLPASEVVIDHDSWDVVGLRGTGS